MNPFCEKPMDMWQLFENWEQIYPKPYNKNTVDPYTKCRIILMNGTEFEQVWFGHQFARNCNCNELRRELAVLRRSEQQQQKTIAALKAPDESILEHTISYEQLAVDLTCALAKNEPDCNVKSALDFALLEDFDHLYRYANLLEMEQGVRAERLVGGYTEITPGRPTISHHRYPADNVHCFINNKTAKPITVLNVGIITAAEQQTMNYYMNVVPLYTSDLGRQLYQEIGMVEEEHVTQYGQLMDPNATWLENLLLHQYTECYLYYSMCVDETDPYIRKIWDCFFHQEVTHLHYVAGLLKKYEGKQWEQVIPCGDFPELLSLHSNIDYVRCVLANTAWLTSRLEEYVDVCKLPANAPFFRVQNIVNPTPACVPSHRVIDKMILKNQCDYRYELSQNPLPELRCRTKDNTSVGRSCK